ncbi:MAG TPA: EamA family transporter [Bryobacteraceae bacterium]|nr:EamA family transporter [Bryobacteraceae bacterium]
MKWMWLAITVLSSTAGDLASAKGMVAHGEIEHFGPRRVGRLLRYISTHPLIVAGIAFNAISFFSFLALLTVAEISFAVPASAISYVLKTALAGWYLDEHVNARRWIGAACVALGVYLLGV